MYCQGQELYSKEHISRFITNEKLKSSITSLDVWEQEYIDLTSIAIEKYINSGRKRFACRLQHELALLYLNGGNFVASMPLLSNVSKIYWSEQWYTIHCSTLKLLAQCQRVLGYSAEFIESCVCLLKDSHKKVELCGDEKI